MKSLYAAHKSGASPFFQTKNRARVDKYFRKDLADLIWKDAVSAKGEAGAIDFDPLYGSQDPQITNFIIMDTGWGGDSKFGPAHEAVVQVTFKDAGKERMVSYQFKQGRDKVWKIYDVHYRSAGSEVKLAALLAGASAATQTSAGHSEVQQIQGELQVGKTQSLILYFGMESGDYAAYCFANNSQAGRAILAACKNRQRCEARAPSVNTLVKFRASKRIFHPAAKSRESNPLNRSDSDTNQANIAGAQRTVSFTFQLLQLFFSVVISRVEF